MQILQADPYPWKKMKVDSSVVRQPEKEKQFKKIVLASLCPQSITERQLRKGKKTLQLSSLTKTS